MSTINLATENEAQMKLSDLILDEAVSNSTWRNFPAEYWWLYAAIVVVCAIVLLSLIFVGGKNKFHKTRWVVGIIAVFTVIVAPFISESFYPEIKTIAQEEKSNSEKIQVWAEENYAITLSSKDAKILYAGKIDYDTAKHGVYSEASAITTYYGEKIVITLIKEDNQWRLFSNDRELPAAGVNK